MRFSPKWSQNVSKLLRFNFSVLNKWFQLKNVLCKNKYIYIYIYTENLTPHILQCEFSQTGGTGVDVKSKTKSRIDLKMGTNM